MEMLKLPKISDDDDSDEDSDNQKKENQFFSDFLFIKEVATEKDTDNDKIARPTPNTGQIRRPASSRTIRNHTSKSAMAFTWTKNENKKTKNNSEWLGINVTVYSTLSNFDILDNQNTFLDLLEYILKMN
ncbi:hypothetical protein CHS0354_023319 [Potamilus streckersoni]|uniref:Uncharacterized protein n=1 Tax=Potamilus streckersoni TaxID=2493646 RepID=A0AAE0T580_9BIVA|nr:hypothetical protein CHS0354_023319 [Potamilus streckersoni]